MADKPAISDVAERFASYLRQPGNGEWGSLHIVLADGNTDDGSVRWCAEWARERGDDEGEQLAGILLSMSRTQRRKLPFVVDQKREQGDG